MPSISLEGRSFWIAKTAPLSLDRLWWSKFWVGLVPLLVLAEILVLATNYYLKVIPLMMWLSTLTLCGMTFSIVALGLAVGAVLGCDGEQGRRGPCRCAEEGERHTLIVRGRPPHR